MTAFPVDTLEDWASYADALATFEVRSETELPLTDAEQEAGEGLVMRSVEIAVQDVLWARQGAPKVPETVSFITYGWVIKGSERRPANTGAGARLEVGDRYLAPLANSRMGGWGPLSPGQVFRVDGDRITMEWTPTDDTAAKRIGGRSLDEAARILDATEPDPLTVKYSDLDPIDRAGAAQAEAEALAKEETQPTGPSPPVSRGR